MPGHGRRDYRNHVVIVAEVTGSNVLEGRTFLTCEDPVTGQTWDVAPAKCLAGGSSRFVIHGADVAIRADVASPGGFLSPGQNTQVVLIPYGPGGRSVHVIGFVQHTDLGLVTTTIAPVAGADHTRDVSDRDHCRANGGTRDILDERGAWTVDLTEATDPNARVQLPAAGVLRASRSGAAAERTLLANATLAYFAGMEAYLADLEARIDVAAAAGAVMQPAAVARPTADNTLKAAVLHISADPEP